MNEANAVISFQAITHHYKTTRALDAISHQITSGSMTGLIGPDGVGKSTLISLIAGVTKLQEGQMIVLGGDMADSHHRRAVCPRISYMPQGLGKNLYASLSVEENLDFFGRLFGQDHQERKQRIQMLTQATGLAPFTDRPAGKLSGGMKQKLGLCCALLHDPDLLLLDEPTTGVDPVSRMQFWSLIDSIRQERPDMSVLVSTAYMDEADQFEYLISMHDGKLLAADTPQNLKQQTDTDNLEDAFVELLPLEKRQHKTELIIPPRKADGHATAIQADKLTRRFGDFTAVREVSFTIEQGEIFGFLGSNGCGKTTTMKMLTGLLPASEGHAELFGQSLKGGGTEIRKRVGYMSQAFSLYDELTVEQNLLLHARLFHIPQADRQSRLDELIEEFELDHSLDQLAKDLPLGIRQRLSLAVAIIHKPEILILDEPTSGVDPIARDHFWQMLIKLSREDRVTIFISTHFMNEALRCDRISLMHAGEVLACDTPEALQKSKQTETLEEAFIDYIQAATKESDASNSQVGLTSDNNGADTHKQSLSKRFSLRRVSAYSYLESLEILRDPIRLAFAFIGSILFMLVLGYGISLDVDEVHFAAFDQDRSPQSMAYVEAFNSSRYFSQEAPLYAHTEIEKQLQQNHITLAIDIPSGFGKRLRSGHTAEIAIWVDGANPSRADTIEGYAQGVHETYVRNYLVENHPDLITEPAVTVQQRYIYNPSFESVFAIVPSIPPLLLMLIPAILMAVSIVKEKELGSITNFYVTPTTQIEFLLGKQIPYIIVGLISFLLLTLVSYLIFQVPIKGSAIMLLLCALVYVSASTGIGLVISSFTKSQVAAVFVTAIITMIPTIQFSGLMQPVSTLSGQAQTIGSLWPTTYYMHASVGAFTKGLGFSELRANLIALIIFTPVLLLLASISLRKQTR